MSEVNGYDFDKLEKSYKEFSFFIKQALEENYSKDVVDKILKEALEDFKALIPKIPFIGGEKNAFTQYIVITGMLTPMVKILDKMNKYEEEIGKLIFNILKSYTYSTPEEKRVQRGESMFKEETKQLIRNMCLESQKRNQKYDWVCEYVEGIKDSFAFGTNMTRCGNIDFWKKHGLEKYVKYLCLSDYPSWKASNIEVIRTQNLALSGKYCDFRYIKVGDKGPEGWPPESLEEWK